MSFKKVTASISLFFTFYFGQAQTSASYQAQLPNLVPPSPEVASLVKAGDLNAGLHSGTANASIPLFNITAGSFSLPISLSYSSNGIKVNETPSRVGLGWNLVAGGSVSRIVHDEPDGESTYLPPVDFYTQNTTLLNYLLSATLENNDTEFDEYSFSVNGLSGKFYLDPANNGKTIQHSNLKISKQGAIFIITGPDGVKYYFGESTKIEKTRNITVNSGVSKSKVQSSTWFLTKIETPDGESILFSYSPIYIHTWQGPSQSVVLQQSNYDPNTDCGICQGMWANATMNAIEYDTYYLSSISTSNGSLVEFVYGARPDATGDNRLTEVRLSTTNGESTAKLISKYQFEYQDISNLTTQGDPMKRFYLKKVKTVPLDVSMQNTEYVMDYNDPDGMPSISSFAQDHFGYYNGKTQNLNFFPIPTGASNYVHASEGGDRSPDFTYSQKGMLQKITYPTGGYQQFYFEPHTIAQDQVTTVFNVASLAGNGDPNNPAATKTYNTYFTVQNVQTGSLYLKSFRTPGFNPDVPPPPTGPDWVIRCYLINASTNAIINNWGFTNYSEITYPVLLTTGINYKLQLVVYGGDINAGNARMSFDPTTATASVNIPMCGLRVSQIKSYDPVTTKATNKFYTYASLSDPSKSSGIGVLPVYQMFGNLGGVCQNFGQIIYTCTNALQVSSSSINPTFTFGGSSVAYQNVIESDDYYWVNGGTEHTFFTSTSSTGATNILGTNILAGPLNISADMNGMEQKTVVFKRVGVTNVILRQVVNTYSLDSRVNGQLTSVITKKRFTPPLGAYSPAENLRAFDLGQYFFSNSWVHLDQTTTTEYDQDGLNPLTNSVTYQYNSINHLQPTQTQTSNSQGATVISTMKYPEDYPTTAVYTQMVGKNVVTPVIESTTSVGGVPTSTVRTEYKDWFNNGITLKPEYIKSGKGGPSTIEPRIQYYGYDNNGNPLEVSKTNDIRNAYIWDYNKAYVVAEIKTTATSSPDVYAYTSFEADGSGNWSIGSAIRDITTSITGKKSYLLSNAPINFTGLNIAKTYVISYWTRNASAYTITGTLSGYPIQGRTVSGWTYFEHKISGQSAISIIGSGNIDELRLYPDKSFMSTYTFNPLIGVTSQCDVNNRISYYEYDGFNRVVLIRDQDKNIAKKFCYNYAGQVENCQTGCTNTTANWQNTTTALRCQINGSGQNTGYQEQEQIDINTCSPTYNQTHWVIAGQNTTACPPPTTVTITSTNFVNLSGYTADYYNTVTGQTISFTIPSTGGLQTLGTIPPGTYNLTISKPGGNFSLTFGSGCNGQVMSGVSATFFNITVTTTTCNSIFIDAL